MLQGGRNYFNSISALSVPNALQSVQNSFYQQSQLFQSMATAAANSAEEQKDFRTLQDSIR